MSGEMQQHRVVISICGASGAGKSTLAKTLVTALSPERCTRVAADYYLLPATGTLAEYLMQPVQYDWALLAEDLAAPEGTVIALPDFDFVTFQRHSLSGPRSFVVRPILIVDAIYPYPEATLTVQLTPPATIRQERIAERDTRWQANVAARWQQLEQSRLALAAHNVTYDLAFTGLENPQANAEQIITALQLRGLLRS